MVIAGNVLHLLDEPKRAVGCLLACVSPGGRLILPTYLQGEAGLGFRAAIGLYQALGFRFREQYTLESYWALIESCGAEVLCLKRLEGRLPVGFGVLKKL